MKSQKYPIYYVSLIKLELSLVLLLGFRYFELRDILNYKIFINEFQFSSEFVIDSGVGLVLSF